jgi:alpha-galactosidase
MMNREVLAVNQDALGKPARRVKQRGPLQVWKKPLADGAVALINRGSTGRDITLRAGDIGLLDTPKLARNLWAQQDMAELKEQLTQRVQPHETILLKVTP